MKVTFKEKSHSYNKGKKNFTSVTTLIDKYKNKFDREHWSSYKALQNLLGPRFKELAAGWDPKDPALLIHLGKFVPPQDLKDSISSIKGEWREKNKTAINRGNKYHLAKENLSYMIGHEVNPFTQEKAVVISPTLPGADLKEALHTDLSELEDGYYPELLLFNEEYMLAGTADKGFISSDGNKRYVDVDDYKTNNKIRKQNKYQKMLDPLERFDDCNYNHYRLQVSLYAWMLEQFGFKVRHTAFTHFNNPYKFRYLRKDVIKLLEHYGKSK